MRKITVLLLLTSVFTVIAAYTFAQFSPWPMVLVRCFLEDRVVLQTNEALASLVLLGVADKRNPAMRCERQGCAARRVFPSAIEELMSYERSRALWAFFGRRISRAIRACRSFRLFAASHRSFHRCLFRQEMMMRMPRNLIY